MKIFNSSKKQPIDRGLTSIFLGIAVWLAVAESAIMATFYVLDLRGIWDIVVDPLILAVITTPAIYLIILKPIRTALGDRKEAEDALRESEEKFRTLYEASTDAVILFDENVFFDCNKATLQMFGYATKEEFCSKTPATLSPPTQPDGTDSRTLADKLIATTMKEGRNQFEWIHRRADGTTFPADVMLSTVDICGRRILQSVVRDISERKAAEEQLRSNEEKLRTITDAALDAVIMMDSRGNVAHWNPAAERIFGYSAEEMFGRNIHNILTPPRYRQQAINAATKFLKSGQGAKVGRTRELEALRKDGSEFPMEMSISSIKVADQWCAVAVIRDITERKRAENELIEAKKIAETATQAKSEFLANMSHEIRTPMTAILGFSDVLLENLEKKEDLSAASIIKRNGKYLLGLINDILDLSKIEAGKFEVEQIACSPPAIVADVASLIGVRARSKNIPLYVEYVGAIPETIQCDPIRLRQILINLLGNAIKFTETGSVRLVIRLVQGLGSAPCLQFDVIDTGIGLSEEQISTLFQPFSQADASATRRFGGTGLGLAISKRLAEMMGGDITVRSSLGKGSTFSLTVRTGPLDGVAMLENPAEIVTETKKDVKPPISPEVKLDCRILLAEDGPDNQRLISFVLKIAGAEVTVAENGQIACQCAMAARDERNPFHVILMDMQMPVLDGYEATRRLRKEGYTGPIIALTANAMAGDDEKCREAGCDDYMSKPIDREQLVAAVAQYAKKNPQDVEETVTS